jgi:uncharacterized repeat protein (TIGR01451 family)
MTMNNTHPILFYARAILCALALLLVAQAVRAAEPNITPSVSGPVAAAVGTPFTYTVRLSNIGTGATKGMVSVTDALDASLAINSVSTSSAMFSCTLSGQTVSCTTKSAIAAGTANAGVAIISVTPKAAGTVHNVVAVSGGGDASPTDNKTYPITTNVAAAPAVAEFADVIAPTTPIPTLSPPMLIVLASLLALGGVVAMRRAGHA